MKLRMDHIGIVELKPLVFLRENNICGAIKTSDRYSFVIIMCVGHIVIVLMIIKFSQDY
jgi:hypothetical protein